MGWLVLFVHGTLCPTPRTDAAMVHCAPPGIGEHV
jgi:hypothetical protein